MAQLSAGAVIALDGKPLRQSSDRGQGKGAIHHIALNLLSQESSAKVGKKVKRLKAGWDNTSLTQVLAGAG